MRRDTLNYLIPLLLVALGATAVWRLRPLPGPTSASVGSEVATRVYYLDVAGWYRVTGDETAVLSPLDLSMEEIRTSLAHEVAGWLGEDLGPHEDIEQLYDEPEVAVQRRFENDGGESVWLSAIASRGPKSYRVFEHTPHICYPSQGWAALEEAVHRVPVGRGSVPVNRGLYDAGDSNLLVYSWYLWNVPDRDPSRGVSSWQLATYTSGRTDAAERRLEALFNHFFNEVVDWHRF